MKKYMAVFGLAVPLLVGFLTTASAQDWMKVNPKMLNLLVDTTIVRAYVVTLAPGEKSGIHSHPSEFFYALTDGKINVYYVGSDTVLYDLKAGESGFSDPERPHWVQNIGKKAVKWIEVEFKEHPFKE